MTAPVLRPLSTGEVLDVSFGLYRARFVDMILIAATFRALPLAARVYVAETGGFGVHLGINLLILVLSLFLGALGIAATTMLVASTYLNEPMSALGAIQGSLRMFGKVLGLTLLLDLVIGIGLLALLVPGIVLGTGLAVSLAIVVLEPLGPVAAMNRAWDLSRGSRWKIFGVLLTGYMLLLVPSIAFTSIVGIASIVRQSHQVATEIFSNAVGILATPFLYISVTVLYYDLRVRKEGFDLELLSEATPHP